MRARTRLLLNPRGAYGFPRGVVSSEAQKKLLRRTMERDAFGDYDTAIAPPSLGAVISKSSTLVKGDRPMNTFQPNRANSHPGAGITTQLILGLWLLVSPFVVGFAINEAVWAPMLAGAAVVILAMVRARRPPTTTLSFVSLLPGLWLLAAPFLFDYIREGAFWNSMITGVLAVVLARPRRTPAGNATLR